MGINRITREDIMIFNGTLLSYQSIATQSAIYPGQGTALGLMYVALKMNGEAGELAEHVGKAMRDDGFGVPPAFTRLPLDPLPLTDYRRDLVIKEIGDVLWYLSAACNELGITLQHAAHINLEKLCDRSERDALQGSGDNR